MTLTDWMAGQWLDVQHGAKKGQSAYLYEMLTQLQDQGLFCVWYGSLQKRVLRSTGPERVKAHLISTELLQKSGIFEWNTLFSAFAAKICSPT